MPESDSEADAAAPTAISKRSLPKTFSPASPDLKVTHKHSTEPEDVARRRLIEEGGTKLSTVIADPRFSPSRDITEVVGVKNGERMWLTPLLAGATATAAGKLKHITPTAAVRIANIKEHSTRNATLGREDLFDGKLTLPEAVATALRPKRGGGSGRGALSSGAKKSSTAAAAASSEMTDPSLAAEQFSLDSSVLSSFSERMLRIQQAPADANPVPAFLAAVKATYGAPAAGVTAADACALAAVRSAMNGTTDKVYVEFVTVKALENASMSALLAMPPRSAGTWLNTLTAEPANVFATAMAARAAASVIDAASRAHTDEVARLRAEMRASEVEKKFADEALATASTRIKELEVALKTAEDAARPVTAATAPPAPRHKNGKRHAEVIDDDDVPDEVTVIDSSDRHTAKKTAVAAPPVVAAAPPGLTFDD
jgi:hypothetical protein